MSVLDTAQGGPARRGTYWSFGSGELVRLQEEGTLPGPPSRRWIRLPAVLLLLLGPVLGLVFLMFLPVVGIVLILYLPLQALFQKATAPRDTGDDDGPGDAATHGEDLP